MEHVKSVEIYNPCGTCVIATEKWSRNNEYVLNKIFLQIILTYSQSQMRLGCGNISETGKEGI